MNYNNLLDFLNIKFIRYCIAGGIVAFVYFFLFYILNNILLIDIYLSILLSYSIAALTRYYIHKIWVFKNKIKFFNYLTIKYIIMIIISYFFNIIITKLILLMNNNTPILFAVLLSSIFALFFSYMMSKLWVFRGN